MLRAGAPPLWSWTNPESCRAPRPLVQPLQVPTASINCCHRAQLPEMIVALPPDVYEPRPHAVPMASGPQATLSPAPGLNSPTQCRSPAASCRLCVPLTPRATHTLAASSTVQQ